MNECLKILQTRRSVKSYESTPVPQEMLNEVLKAGMNAPTGMNRQSPVMVAVTDPETVRYIGRLNAQILNSTADPFYGVPAVIIVFADSSISTFKEDGCLVMGNLLNAATSLGLGACWIHRAREVFETPEGKKLKEKWGLGSQYTGIGNCILGYPKETPEPKTHKTNYIIYDK